MDSGGGFHFILPFLRGFGRNKGSASHLHEPGGFAFSLQLIKETSADFEGLAEGSDSVCGFGFGHANNSIGCYRWLFLAHAR